MAVPTVLNSAGISSCGSSRSALFAGVLATFSAAISVAAVLFTAALSLFDVDIVDSLKTEPRPPALLVFRRGGGIG
jgi:hypothetical protein